jgi:hypothetical protein
MELNSYIIAILQCLETYGNETVKQQIVSNQDVCHIKLDENNVIQIQKNALNINETDIEYKIKTTDQTTKIIEVSKFNTFISSIAGQITRINHIGISYACPSITNELTYYQELITGTSLGLFEETSNDPQNRWFFIKSNKQIRDPMFEIVLTETKQLIVTDWVPHIQIDIDTTCSYASIIEKTNATLRKSFISWNLDIPNYGIVLTMGSLGKIHGTNITIGIGTNLRGNQTLKKLDTQSAHT